MEQTDADYLLLYSSTSGPAYRDGHITVAVAGDFPGKNGLTFRFEGQMYSIAETIFRGFRIGGSSINFSLDRIDMVQPRPDSEVYTVGQIGVNDITQLYLDETLLS